MNNKFISLQMAFLYFEQVNSILIVFRGYWDNLFHHGGFYVFLNCITKIIGYFTHNYNSDNNNTADDNYYFSDTSHFTKRICHYYFTLSLKLSCEVRYHFHHLPFRSIFT